MSNTSKITQDVADKIMDNAMVRILGRLGPNAELIQLLLPPQAIRAIIAATLIEVPNIQKAIKDAEANG